MSRHGVAHDRRPTGVVGVSGNQLSGRRAGLLGCRFCGETWPAGRKYCGRCGGRLSSPDRRTLQTVWAFWVLALIFYIPANLQPMMITSYFGMSSGTTILGGVIIFAQLGDWFVASVIFIASFVIPISKFTAIAVIALSIRRAPHLNRKARHKLQHFVEFIGRWSMIDVFVVALMSALLQLGFLAKVDPGAAAAPFALSVVLTMISANRLDSRLIWED